MKTNSKKIFVSLLGFTLVFGLVSPVASYAQTAPARVNFCSRIDQIIAPIEQRMTDRDTKLKSKWQEVDANLAKRIAERSARLTDRRGARDENREAHYAKLEARATNDAQKQAVANFKTTVESAVVTRKASVDSAILALQQSIAQTIEARRVAVTAAKNELTTAKSAAIAKAKTDCSAGVDPKTVRETFRASMKAAQDKFRTDYQSIGKLKGSFESVRQIKKQAVEKAISDFKIVLEKARTDLKVAFK